MPMKHPKKSILFLSAMDFKEKSTEVIRKTPEAFAQAGWEVFYVVVRDTSKFGDYYYEREINPPGVTMYRFPIPWTNLIDNYRDSIFFSLLWNLRIYLTILSLAFYARKNINFRDIDVIYGYEAHGVLAVNILRLLGKTKNKLIISRFQGTWLYLYIKQFKIKHLLLDWFYLLAYSLPCDLFIMTDDGTEGDKIYKLLHKYNNKLKFWLNGVEPFKVKPEAINHIRISYSLHDDTIVLLSISRLASWKRIDRGLHVVASLIKNYGINNLLYLIVGEGDQKRELQELSRFLGVEKYVNFVGAVNNEEVYNYFHIADIFLSTYDLSNLGNPLLEAIRAHKIIFTLNNGDTGKIIRHGENGFIYDINDNLINKLSEGIFNLINDKGLQNLIKKNISLTEQKMLWTWSERLSAEVMAIDRLLSRSMIY
jgi:glycosyltransferase involved in cell wall biosynthesis